METSSFNYDSRFKTVKRMQQEAIWRQYGIKLDTRHFTYKMAKAHEVNYSTGKRVKRKVNVLEGLDRETNVKIQYELDEEKNIHVLFIGNKKPERPAGFYKTKKTMLRFREWTIEENGCDSAWGRSLASQYSTKTNVNRYSQYNGDWRRAKASIRDNKGNLSKHMDKLSGFYMRTGLWIPIEWENYEKEGMKILMPTRNKYWEMVKEDSIYVKELFKYAKRNYEQQYK